MLAIDAEKAERYRKQSIEDFNRKKLRRANTEEKNTLPDQEGIKKHANNSLSLLYSRLCPKQKGFPKILSIYL